MLKEMRQKEAGSSAQALRREGGRRLPSLMELGRSVGLLLHPLESNSDIPRFPRNFRDPSQSWWGLSPCLTQMPSACSLTSAEFCRALSSWRANMSPRCPAQGQLRAAAQKILFNPDGPEVWDVDGRNLPLDAQQGEGRWPWQRTFSDSYLLPSLWPQAPEKGGQLQESPPARGLAKAHARPGKPPGPHGPGLGEGTSAQNWVWSLSPPGQSSGKDSFEAQYPPSLYPVPFQGLFSHLPGSSFQLFSPVPTNRFSSYPCFPPRLCNVLDPLLSLFALSTIHRCP